MSGLWRWISNSRNQRTLGFLGGGIAAIATAAWAVFMHFDHHETPPDGGVNVHKIAGGQNIVGGTVSIGTANFGGPVPHSEIVRHSVSQGGPTFLMPKLDGRTIDGCVMTPKAQSLAEGDPDACNIPAQMRIASQFCEEAHFTRAVNFHAENTGIFQTSYKLAEVLTSDGEQKRVWNKDDGGGFIFTSITCK